MRAPPPLPAAGGQPVLILAAGHGKRMGGPKVFARHGGRTFLEWILERCRESQSRVTMVVDPRFRPQVEALLNAPSATGGTQALRLVEADGTLPMLASVRAGLAGLAGAEPGAAGCWVWPVDAPFISAAAWLRAARTVAEQPASILKLRSGGKTGHPLWLPDWALARIRSGDWPNGLLGFLAECPPERIRALELPGEDVRDFNTPEQLASLRT